MDQGNMIRSYFLKSIGELLRYSPDGMLDVKSFQSALQKEYDMNVKEADLDKLCRKFDDSKDNDFKGFKTPEYAILN